jgi:hypothetical protein
MICSSVNLLRRISKPPHLKNSIQKWRDFRGAGHQPIFSAAVAMEFPGFTGPEVPQVVAALREKRRPGFVPTSPV